MDPRKKALTRSRLEGLAILLVALGYLWEAHNVPSFYQVPGVPGPTTFPLLLGVVFALAGLWLLVSPEKLLARRRKPVVAEDEGQAEPDGAGLGQRLLARWDFYAIWALILGYLALLPGLGFPLATALLLGPFFYLLGERRWWLAAALAVAVTAATYAIFALGLNVQLPLGVLASLLK